MRALAMRHLRKAEVCELGYPNPVSADVTVKVEAVALSIPEVHAFNGERFAHFRQELDPERPFVFGFAAVGRLTAVAGGCLASGRYVLSPIDACATCRSCRSGKQNLCPGLRLAGIDIGGVGFAREEVTLPAERLFRLPAGFGPLDGCVVSEVATAIHALRRGRLGRDESVAVVGAGRHGQQLLRVARRVTTGSVVAVDVAEDRRAAALSAGALEAFAPAEAPQESFDVVVHANDSADSIDLCLDLSRRCGRVVLLGTPAARDLSLHDCGRRMVASSRRLVASQTKTATDFRRAIEMMSESPGSWGIRDPVVVSLADGPAALEYLSAHWPDPRSWFLSMEESAVDADRSGGGAS